MRIYQDGPRQQIPDNRDPRGLVPANSALVERVIRFLNSIGLEATLKSGARGFVPGVQIKGGTLVIDPCAALSAILHEAGHLAIMPSVFRP